MSWVELMKQMVQKFSLERISSPPPLRLPWTGSLAVLSSWTRSSRKLNISRGKINRSQLLPEDSPQCLPPTPFLYSLSAAFLPATHIILHRDVRFWWPELTFSLCPSGTTCSFPESELTSPAPGGLTVSRWRELGIIKKKKIFFLGGQQ